MSPLPQYIVTGGMQVYQQPYLARNVVMQTFLLRADYTKLVRTVNQSLNIDINSQYEYRPLLPYVQLNVMQCRQMGSANPPESLMGWQFESDISFTVWVGAGPLMTDDFKIDHVATFYPYCFVDSPSAVLSGREVYGFYKETGWFDLDSWNAGRPLRVTADVLDPFAPTTKMQKRDVVTIKPTGPGTPPSPVGELGDIGQIIRQILGTMLGDGDGVANIPTATALQQFGHDLLTNNVPLVFLKQFRDTGNGAAACYQAIVEADMKTWPKSMALLSNDYTIEVADFDSHPIASDLGLKPSQAPAVVLSTEFDFTTDVGRVVAGGSS